MFSTLLQHSLIKSLSNTYKKKLIKKHKYQWEIVTVYLAFVKISIVFTDYLSFTLNTVS